MLRPRSIPWRYVLPAIIFPVSMWSWIQYQLSVRVFDDSPVPWYWYGGLWSACLNFPAYNFPAPFETLHRLHFRIGRLWIEPRIISFFLIVLLFWFWIGTRFESWVRAEKAPRVSQGFMTFRLVVLALTAALWLLFAVGTVYDTVHFLRDYWRYTLYIAWDLDMMKAAQLLWSVLLAVYYLRRFLLGVRAKFHPKSPPISTFVS